MISFPMFIKPIKLEVMQIEMADCVAGASYKQFKVGLGSFGVHLWEKTSFIILVVFTI